MFAATGLMTPALARRARRQHHLRRRTARAGEHAGPANSGVFAGPGCYDNTLTASDEHHAITVTGARETTHTGIDACSLRGLVTPVNGVPVRQVEPGADICRRYTSAGQDTDALALTICCSDTRTLTTWCLSTSRPSANRRVPILRALSAPLMPSVPYLRQGRTCGRAWLHGDAFSFNAGNGRCPTSGSGFEHVEMQFRQDVYRRRSDWRRHPASASVAAKEGHPATASVATAMPLPSCWPTAQGLTAGIPPRSKCPSHALPTATHCPCPTLPTGSHFDSLPPAALMPAPTVMEHRRIEATG